MSYRRPQLRSLLLYLCYVFRALVNSLVRCWFCTSALGLDLFQISNYTQTDRSDHNCFQSMPGSHHFNTLLSGTSLLGEMITNQGISLLLTAKLWNTCLTYCCHHIRTFSSANFCPSSLSLSLSVSLSLSLTHTHTHTQKRARARDTCSIIKGRKGATSQT